MNKENVLKVKACCWVCNHFVIDWDKKETYCSLGRELPRYPVDIVCENFELWGRLKPKEGD